MSDHENKKLKLSLDDLQVQSFVTALDGQEALGFLGGANSLNPEETENVECCRDLTLPRSGCQLCGSAGQGCDDSLVRDFCTFAANCGTGRWC